MPIAKAASWRSCNLTSGYTTEQPGCLKSSQANLQTADCAIGGEDLTTSTAAALNRLAAETAAVHDIPFIDLHPVFAAGWLARGQRFEFSIDNHWNERGHALAAGAIEAALNGHADATQDCSD